MGMLPSMHPSNSPNPIQSRMRHYQRSTSSVQQQSGRPMSAQPPPWNSRAAGNRMERTVSAMNIARRTAKAVDDDGDGGQQRRRMRSAGYVCCVWVCVCVCLFVKH